MQIHIAYYILAKDAEDFAVGKLTQAEFEKRWEVADYSDLYAYEEERTVKSAEEIAELTDSVGVVLPYNDQWEFTEWASGFLVAGGYFVTPQHIGGEAAGMHIRFGDDMYYDVNYYYANDPTHDLYVVYPSTQYNEIGDPIGYSPLLDPLDYTTEWPQVGDKVFAIGSPEGLDNTITEGKVTALKEIDGVTFIEHTAPVVAGSNGGPLLNEYGEAIGMTTLKFDGSNLALPMQDVIESLY